ncbi:MAG: mechanosensitive ion channel [Kofleriaceae bacterium]
MIDLIRILAIDCGVVFGGAVVVALVARFANLVVEAVPMARARRALVARGRPLAVAVLAATYAVFATRWVLGGDDRRAWIAFAVVLGVACAAAWSTLRDLIDGVVLRLGGSLEVGDRVDLAGVQGRILRLGARAVVIETVGGQLAVVPNRTAASSTIRREPISQQAGFHVFRVPLPPARSIPELKRGVHEAVLLCHWSSTRRPPQVSATDDGHLEVMVFPVDADHVAELERVVAAALA